MIVCSWWIHRLTCLCTRRCFETIQWDRLAVVCLIAFSEQLLSNLVLCRLLLYRVFSLSQVFQFAQILTNAVSFLPSKRVSLFLQSRMVVNVSLVPQHRKRLTNMENQMTVSLMGKEEGWPITFITSKVRYKRSIAIYGLYRFIVHPKYFAVSDWLKSSGHFS